MTACLRQQWSLFDRVPAELVRGACCSPAECGNIGVRTVRGLRSRAVRLQWVRGQYHIFDIDPSRVPHESWLPRSHVLVLRWNFGFAVCRVEVVYRCPLLWPRVGAKQW